MDKFNKKEPKEKLFLKFTDLFAKKQDWLVEQLNSDIDIYLICRSGQPIKLSLPEIG